MKKIIAAEAVLFASVKGMARALIPSAAGAKNPLKSKAAASRRFAGGNEFRADANNSMETRGYGGVSFDKQFCFAGGHCFGNVLPSFGRAVKTEQYYLAVRCQGMIVK